MMVALTGTLRAEEPKKDDEAANEKIATQRATLLDTAVKTYYTQNKAWPSKLTDIVPLLVNGKKELLDPWGKEYQFQIKEVKEKGETFELPFIWTERTVGKETKVYGKKPPEKKEDKKPADKKQQ
jgi:hypothetical protein